MKRLVSLLILACSLGGCVATYDEVFYDAYVVDAQTFEPAAQVPVIIDYVFLETLNPADQFRARTDGTGHVQLAMADWGSTYVQVGSTRYLAYSCSTPPYGWLHPSGAEWRDTTEGGFVVMHPAPREELYGGSHVLPAGRAADRPLAIYLRPNPDSGSPASTGRCRYAPLFPAP